MCRIYVSFVLVTEVHPGAETFVGQGEIELSVLQCENAPSPPTAASPHFWGRFPKNQGGLSTIGIETLLEALAEVSPAPQRQQESCTPLPGSQARTLGSLKWWFCLPALQS